MSKLFKTLTLLIVALLCFTAVACNPPNNGDNQSSAELVNYEYELNGDGDGYILTKYIGDKTLTKVTLPSKAKGKPVTELGKNLFRKTNIVEVVMPEEITIVGEGAFNSCAELTTIDTKNVQYFKTSSFEGCLLLANVDFSSAKSIGTKAFKDCVKLTQISVPSTVQTIQTGAFSGCIRLGTVNLASGVKELGTEAFVGCSALSNINLENVMKIGEKALSSCISLSSVNLANVSIIDKNAFNSCQELKTVTVGASCIQFYANSFVFCYKLESLQFAPYDNSNKWISIDYNLLSPDVVWAHYQNTTKFVDAEANAESLGTTMGNPKKDNYYCKRAYLDQYPFAPMVQEALYEFDVKGCSCIANGMPDCNITVNGEVYTQTQYTIKVGEPITFACYLSWGPGVPNRSDTLQISSVKYGGVWQQPTDYTNNNGAITFLHAYDGTVEVNVYNSTTSKVVTFTIVVEEA